MMHSIEIPPKALASVEYLLESEDDLRAISRTIRAMREAAPHIVIHYLRTVAASNRGSGLVVCAIEPNGEHRKFTPLHQVFTDLADSLEKATPSDPID